MKIIRRKVGESLSLECGGVRRVVTLLGHGSPPQLGVEGRNYGDLYVFYAHRPLQLDVGGHACILYVLPARPGETRNALAIGVEAPREVAIERIKVRV